MSEINPWSAAAKFNNDVDGWVPTEHQERCKAYLAFERFFWSEIGAFHLQTRGSNESPIYLPSPRTIINTCNRYTAPGISIIPDPEFGTAAERAETLLAVRSLLDRERFRSAFSAAKRYGLVHGDMAIHISADPEQPEGRRLSIEPLEVGRVFPIPHPDDAQTAIGYHIVTPITNPTTGDVTIERQTYSYNPIWNEPGVPGDKAIYSSLARFKPDEWFDITKAPISVTLPPEALPESITALPVYWIPNQARPKFFYGSSELRGFESVLLGLNQAISDEDLTLAMEGIGMYATTADPPIDPTTNRELPWRLGPGNVVELKGDLQKVGDMWARINGIGSLGPYQDHIKLLRDSVYEAAPAPEVARGIVDVRTAESGISLRMQLGPIIDHTNEKDDGISAVLVQMLFDLKAWFAEYETALPESTLMVPTYRDKIPQNNDARVKEVIAIVDAGIGSPEWGRSELSALGYTFATDEEERIVEAQAARSMASDSFALRADTELNRGENGGAEG